MLETGGFFDTHWDRRRYGYLWDTSYGGSAMASSVRYI